jgi:sugar/nucleoside kinase (ribokinase family)
MADVVCVGILVADIFGSPIDSLPAAGDLALIDRYLLSVGGCAANAAVALRRLGLRPSVVGKVGQDLFGDFVLQDLKRLDIDARFVARSHSHATSCTFIIKVRGQDRRYIHSFGANGDFSLADVNRSALDGARALYVGGYLAMPAFRSEHLVQLFRQAKQSGLITALDVAIPAGARVSLLDVQEVLLVTDVFLPNDNEAQALTGRRDPWEQAEVLSRFNPHCTVVITRGRDGVVARRGDEVLQAGIFKVDSIDESGSGDAFDAGFLVGMLRKWALEKSLRFASAVGASCTRALGCHDGVFTFEEADAFVAEHRLEVARMD